MTFRATLAVAGRQLTQLRRDPRTVALLVLVPQLIITLLRYVFDGQVAAFERVAAVMVGLFPFITMFLVTSIAVLRERTSGTLERLMTLPLSKGDVLAGYALAFGLLAAIQVGVTSAVTFWALGAEVAGSIALVVLIALGNAILGMALGLFVSAFASTEFQAVQFMPAVVLPQLLLCGIFVPTDRMAPLLDTLADALPRTYAVEALQEIANHGGGVGDITLQAGVIAGAIVLALALGAATLPRRTA
jgi:ABC-2 type transport system permease protein